MSAPSRPFLLRFTLALLGMMLLMTVVFVGLGWMVVRQFEVMYRVLGEERENRLWDWYFGFMVNLMPGDRDGDGVCDGWELFDGTDPKNPMSFPAFGALCLSRPTIVAYCGERMSTRWVQGGYSDLNVRWPRGFTAVVSAEEPVLLPKGGAGPPTRGPLVVPVNERGELEFDFLAESGLPNVQIVFGNAAHNRDMMYSYAHFPGWRKPPIPASIDGGSPVAAFKGGKDGAIAEHPVGWVTPLGWSGGYIIEAALAEGNENWLPVGVAEPTETLWRFGNSRWEFFPGYTGPLKFRVVPVIPTPP